MAVAVRVAVAVALKYPTAKPPTAINNPKINVLVRRLLSSRKNRMDANVQNNDWVDLGSL